MDITITLNGDVIDTTMTIRRTSGIIIYHWYKIILVQNARIFYRYVIW